MSKVWFFCYAFSKAVLPPSAFNLGLGQQNSAAALHRRERKPEPELTADMEPKLSPMRWLLFAFIVSFVGLLVAAAGMALHIRRERGRRRKAGLRSGTAEEQPETEEVP